MSIIVKVLLFPILTFWDYDRSKKIQTKEILSPLLFGWRHIAIEIDFYQNYIANHRVL